jgi:hypothetical protein
MHKITLLCFVITKIHEVVTAEHCSNIIFNNFSYHWDKCILPMITKLLEIVL